MQIKARLKSVKPGKETCSVTFQLRGSTLTEELVAELREMAEKTWLVGIEPLHDTHVTMTNQQRRSIFAMVDALSDNQKIPKKEAMPLLKQIFERSSGQEIEDPYSTGDRLTASLFLEETFYVALADGWLPWPPWQAPVTRDALIVGCAASHKCAVCGQHAEEHHIDAIGMGNDRRTVDDSQKRIIYLCRGHHTEAHNKGWPIFSREYNLDEITFKKHDVLTALYVRGWEKGISL